MQKLPVDLLSSGMLSAKPVFHAGALVIGPGEPFSEEVKARLRAARIESVVVLGAPCPGFSMGYDTARTLERLPFLFRKFQQHPSMMRVANLLAHLLTERNTK